MPEGQAKQEARDLADQHPEKVKELVALWFEDAKKYNVLPLIDYSIEKGLEKILDLEYHFPSRRVEGIRFILERYRFPNARRRTSTACRPQSPCGQREN